MQALMVICSGVFLNGNSEILNNISFHLYVIPFSNMINRVGNLSAYIVHNGNFSREYMSRFTMNYCDSKYQQLNLIAIW